MKNITFKGVFTLVFSFILMFLSVSNVNVSANTIYLNGKDIEEELKDVDLTEYEKAGKTTVIYLAEKGFLTKNFSLVVYVYNHTKQLIDQNTLSNVINIACRFDEKNNAIEYGNFNLKFLSKLNDNSVYKFSVVDKNGVLESAYKMQNATTGKRCYKIAGIQLLNVGDIFAKDYDVSLEYRYSGYDNDVISGIKHELDVIETITLDLNYVWYRTDSSSKKYHQNQVNSVYFAVPNKYFENNFKLNSIKAEWYEYKTKPVVVLSNQDKFNAINPYVGVNIGNYNDNIRYGLSYGYNSYKYMETYYTNYDWVYNIQGINQGEYQTIISNRSQILYYLFSTNGKSYKDFILESDVLKNHIYTYNKSSKNGYLPIKNGKVSADLFESTVDDGRIKGYNEKIVSVDDKFDLLSYNETNTWWNKVIDYGFFETLFGETPNDESRKDISPIHTIDLNNDFKDITKVGYNLLMDESFVNDFYNYVIENSNDVESKTTCLFRFGNTDYYSVPLDYNDGYFAQETVFLDFDIIQLDFFDGNKHVIVPVIANPIDGVADVTPPIDFKYDKSWIYYAILGIMLSVVGIGVYSMFKKESS